MKKLYIVIFIILFLETISFAEPFSPVPLEITVEDIVLYDFDGSDVEITVDVVGKPCRAYLFINTRLPEELKPVDLRNGNLGWHYVNKIDTTVYISGAYDLPLGTDNIIIWDGMGSENTSEEYGGTYEPSDAVSPGTYDYYVFGYDDQNEREQVCNFISISYYWHSQYVQIGEYYDNGLPRTQPYLWGNTNWNTRDLHAAKDEFGNVTGTAEGWDSHGPPLNTVFKFPIGSDPDDMTALQTTFMPGFSTTEGEELIASSVIFDPSDENIFYCFHDRVPQKNGALFKWNWEEGGDATIDENWGGYDTLLLETTSEDGIYQNSVGTATDGKYIYLTSPGLDLSQQWDKFYKVNFDGELVAEQNLDEFYSAGQPEESLRNGKLNSLYASRRIPYQALVGGEQSCLTMMIDTSRLTAGNTENYIKWSNGNGDFFLDSGWDDFLLTTNPDQLWQCNYKINAPGSANLNEQYFDSNGIVINNMNYQYLQSFVVYTQDGSGIAYCKFFEDIIELDDSIPLPKGSSQICDTGSAFDGMYLGRTVGTTYYTPGEIVNWQAMDSAHGVITNEPSNVSEESLSAFEIDAPYPNPANPFATIGFSLAETGNAVIDIYNVAGQKVETLADREFAAGKHSIVWDGVSYSAGVYFCTVRTGGMSKTVKLTLVK